VLLLREWLWLDFFLWVEAREECSMLVDAMAPGLPMLIDLLFLRCPVPPPWEMIPEPGFGTINFVLVIIDNLMDALLPF
jgi:hypothetical protein